MAAEASSGTNQQLTLDHSSFEKLLAAAWVLQCLQDQLHGPPLDRDQAIAEPVETHTTMKTANPDLQAVAKPALQLSPEVTVAGNKHAAFTVRHADVHTLAEPVEAQPRVETGSLNFAAAVRVEPKTVEIQKILGSEDKSQTVRPVGILPKLASGKKESMRRQASLDLRGAFNRAQEAFNHLNPRLRVNLTLRALRALGIATPVWLLSLVAALLFLEVWRHASFQSAQATSRPSPPIAEVALNDASTDLTKTTRRVFQDAERADQRLSRPKPTVPLEVSHKHITDPATLSSVQQLSRYEIKGLRRQAKYGDDVAAFTLGMAYEVGRFVPQNCQEAARWVTTAAEAGDAAAQYNLGLRYRDDDGVPANRAESEKWLRKAAAHRNRQARLALKILASR